MISLMFLHYRCNSLCLFLLGICGLLIYLLLVMALMWLLTPVISDGYSLMTLITSYGFRWIVSIGSWLVSPVFFDVLFLLDLDLSLLWFLMATLWWWLSFGSWWLPITFQWLLPLTLWDCFLGPLLILCIHIYSIHMTLHIIIRTFITMINGKHHVSQEFSITNNSILTSMTTLTNISLLLQIQKALKNHCIDLYIFSPCKSFLCLNQDSTCYYYLATFKLCPQTPQCVYWMRRILFSLLPSWPFPFHGIHIGLVRGVMWTLIHHSTLHIWSYISCKQAMLNTSNIRHNQNSYLNVSQGRLSYPCKSVRPLYC